MKLTDGDLSFTGQTIGMRFPLEVPQGATIVHAYVQFAAKGVNTEPTTLTIEGEANDNAPPYTTKSWNITNRPRTLAAASWAPPAWTGSGAAGPAQRTPDLSTVI